MLTLVISLYTLLCSGFRFGGGEERRKGKEEVGKVRMVGETGGSA
jgi:hypothetical protein